MTSHAPEKSPEIHANREAIQVLLVDDQRFVGIALERLLTTAPDIVLRCCHDAADALALASEIRPAVILQDLVMPDIDGLTMVRLFRKHAGTAHTPIIVLSGNHDEETRSRAMAAGANDYLVKLPAKDTLIACIRRHAREHDATTANEQTAATADAINGIASSEETLDRAVIAGFRDEQDTRLPDFAVSLIDLFINDAASQVASLRDAGRRLDARTLKATAHSLKGSSLTIGARRLAALCAEIETSADRNDAAFTDRLTTECDREFVKVRSALAAERQGATQP